MLKSAKKLTQQDFDDLPDFGEKMAEGVFEYFNNKSIEKLFAKLDKTGVKILTNKKIVNQKLKNKTFLFTGELKSMSRLEAQAKS